ncbi:DUF5666 domain-containing protein [Photobacterium halotolerans]|uniref:DUF5666 domain-containing protein n=1 Tax=Photobacterium halotolerans TaxID=265726 RepID=A0A7X5AR15_9GAMM|nr:DUF5666 domain-containing protein [Photobacterium halotolerans]NAW63828.1 hypothetical protein [Photobacterium halotolerans]
MKKILSVAVLGGLLSACGGSDSDAQQQAYSGTLLGTVDSVQAEQATLMVNGRSLDVASAGVSYQDQPLLLTDVVSGMQVEIDSDDGRVSEIELEPFMSGEVTAVDGQSITVNGQTVLLEQVAVSAQVGDFVLLFAQPQADGSRTLTAVQAIDATAISEVEGRVSQLDMSAQTFSVNGTVVNFAGAALDDDPLQNGQWVEVTGMFADGIFRAAEVDAEEAAELDGKELEGVITFVNRDKTAIELNSRTVVTLTANTRYEDGTQSDLITGRVVEVELVNQAGQLTAVELDFELSSSQVTTDRFSIEGTAQYRDDTLSVNGVELLMSATVRLEDGLTKATLDGQWVELEGSLVDGQYLVREIESELQEAEISLQGPVSGNAIWGYVASDASLSGFEGQWVGLECYFDGSVVSQCRLDD